MRKNNRVRRESRRREAAVRKLAREKRGPFDQLNLLTLRGCNLGKEAKRLRRECGRGEQ